MLFSFTNCEKQEELPDRSQATTSSQSFELAEGTTTLLEPSTPSNAVISLNSAANVPILIKIKVVADNSGTVRILERTLEAGEAINEEFPQLVAVVAEVALYSVPVVTTLNFVAVYVPTGDDNGFSASDWIYAGEICLDGAVESEPDQNIDCLWDVETLWQAAGERDIELNIEITGDHDMTVDVEGPVGVYQSYNISAAPALPQFRVLSGEWEGIVAVHFHCMKSPVNPCGSCDFTYELCYK
jgi:hypothetical protein